MVKKMKISEMMERICEEADRKFTDTEHPNDAVSISIYSSGEDWQINLERPTARELDHGEVITENLHTVKMCEVLSGFLTMDVTLVKALRRLLERVELATEWEQ